MKLIECVRAQAALVALKDQRLDYETAHRLLMLQKRLAPHVSFFAEKERELMETYGKKDEEGRLILAGSQWELADTSTAGAYADQMDGLCRVEVEGFEEPITVSAKPDLSMAQLDALADLVIFGGE